MDDIFVEDSFCSWYTCKEDNYITRIKTENILKDLNLNNVNSDVESIKEFEKIEEPTHKFNSIKGSNNDNNDLLKTSTSENIIKNEEKSLSFLPSFLISKLFNSNEQTQQNTSLADKNTLSNNVKVVKTTQETVSPLAINNEKVSNVLKVPNLSTMNKTSSTTLTNYQIEGNDYAITMPGGDLSIFEEGSSMKSKNNQLMNAKTNIEEFVNDRKENIKESLKVSENILKDGIKETKESIKDAKDDFKENLKDKKEDLKETKNQLKESLNNKKESIKENIIDTKNDLKDTKDDVKEFIKDTKENITEGISDTKKNETETAEQKNEDSSNKSNNTSTLGMIFSYFKGFGKNQEHKENEPKMTKEDEIQTIHIDMTNDNKKLEIPSVLNNESSSTTIIGDNEDYIDVKKVKNENIDDENFVKTYEGIGEIKEDSGNDVKDNIKNSTIKNNIDSIIDNGDNNNTINSVISNNVINANNSNDNNTNIINSTYDSNYNNINIGNSTTNQDANNNNKVNTITINAIDDNVNQLKENSNDTDSQQEVVLEEMIIIQNPDGTQTKTKKVTTFITENQEDYNKQIQAIAKNSKVEAPIKDEIIIKEKIEKIDEKNNQPIQTVINDNSHDNDNISIVKNNIVEPKKHEDQTKIINKPDNMNDNSSNTIVQKINTQTESNGKENENDYDNVSIYSIGSDKFSDAFTSSQINNNLKDNLQNTEVINPMVLHNGEDTVIIKHSESTKKSSIHTINGKPTNGEELVLTGEVSNNDNQNEDVNDTAIIINGTQSEVVNGNTDNNNNIIKDEIVNPNTINNNGIQNEIVNDSTINNNISQIEVVNDTANNDIVQNEVVNDNTITKPKKSSKKKQKKRKWYKKIFRMAICKGGDDYY
jgi:hypothetical protein